MHFTTVPRKAGKKWNTGDQLHTVSVYVCVMVHIPAVLSSATIWSTAPSTTSVSMARLLRPRCQWLGQKSSQSFFLTKQTDMLANHLYSHRNVASSWNYAVTKLTDQGSLVEQTGTMYDRQGVNFHAFHTTYNILIHWSFLRSEICSTVRLFCSKRFENV